MRYYSIPTDAVGQWLLDGDALDTNNGVKTHLSGSATWVKEKLGYTNKNAYFNGSQGLEGGTMTIGPSFSVSLWYKFGGRGGANALFSLNERSSSPTDEVVLYVSGNTLATEYANSAGSNVYPYIAVNHNNTRKHVVAIYANNTVRYFINGEEQVVYDPTITSKTITRQFTIGYTVLASNTFYYLGNMKNVRVYDRELTQTEVTALYLEGINGLGGGGDNLISDAYIYHKGDAQSIIGAFGGSSSGVSTVDDRFGLPNALNFNGGAFVALNDNPQLTTATPFSIFARVKSSSSNSSKVVYGSTWFGTAPGSAVCFLSGANFTPHFYIGHSDIGFADINSGVALNDGEWHFILGTYDGAGTCKIYIDGEFAASGSLSGTSNLYTGNSGVNIGNARYETQPGDYAYTGVIGETGIGRYYTETEVFQLYELMKYRYVYPYKKQLPLHLRNGLRMWLTGEHTGATYHNVVDPTTNMTADGATSDRTMGMNKVCKLSGTSGLSAPNYVNNGDNLTMRFQFCINAPITAGTRWLLDDRQTVSLGHFVAYEYNGGSPRLRFTYQKPAVGQTNFYWDITLEPGVMYTLAIVQDDFLLNHPTRCYLNGCLLGDIEQFGAGAGYTGSSISISKDVEGADTLSAPSYANISWTNYMFYDRAITPEEEKQLFYSLYI